MFVGRPGFNQDPYESTGYAHGALARRLYDIPEQRQAFKQRLQELLEELWLPNMLLELTDSLLAVAFDADDVVVDELKEHLRAHGEKLLIALREPLPEVPLSPALETDACSDIVSNIQGSFAVPFAGGFGADGWLDFQSRLDTENVEAELFGY